MLRHIKYVIYVAYSVYNIRASHRNALIRHNVDVTVGGRKGRCVCTRFCHVPWALVLLLLWMQRLVQEGDGNMILSLTSGLAKTLGEEVEKEEGRKRGKYEFSYMMFLHRH